MSYKDRVKDYAEGVEEKVEAKLKQAGLPTWATVVLAVTGIMAVVYLADWLVRVLT